MDTDSVLSLAMQALMVTLKVSAPLLAAGLIVGVLISVFQAVTQIQEQTLSFIPKILVCGAVLALGGPWMLNTLLVYTQNLFVSIPQMVGP